MLAARQTRAKRTAVTTLDSIFLNFGSVKNKGLFRSVQMREREGDGVLNVLRTLPDKADARLWTSISPVKNSADRFGEKSSSQTFYNIESDEWQYAAKKGSFPAHTG